MFVRRALIDAIGAFDMAFGLGYGEENDFCLRAARAGWRNVLADDAFVVHMGGRSFAGQKDALSPRNLALLLERHPHYLRHGARSTSPRTRCARCARRRSRRARARAGPVRGVLHVIHDHGGGTETHVRALIAASRDDWRHYLAIAVGDIAGRWRSIAPKAASWRSTFDRRAHESWRDFVGGFVRDVRNLASSTFTTCPAAATACRRRWPTSMCRSAIPFTISISRCPDDHVPRRGRACTAAA